MPSAILRFSLGLALLTSLSSSATSSPTNSTPDSYKTITGVPYYHPDFNNAVKREKCRMDFRYPTKTPGYATVVWFHGGGLTEGSRFIPDGLQNSGLAVMAVGYRLSPQAHAPEYIEDAAAATAWAFRNVERFGGSTNLIFLSGHSAGAYLASMVTLDRRWLLPHKLSPDGIAGLAAISGQCITHFTIREERGISPKTPVIDDLAPLYHVRPDAPPLLLITGDREKELFGRYEETAYMWRMMVISGHRKTQFVEMPGVAHADTVEPAMPLLLRFVRSIASSSNPAGAPHRRPPDTGK